MGAQLIFLLTIAVYVGGLVYIGFRASHSEEHDDFVIGSRNVGVIPTVGSLAASFRDGMGAVFWTGMAYSAGYGALWLIFGVMLALVFLAVVGPKIREEAKHQGFITIGDFLKSRLGVRSEKVVTLFVLVKSLLFIAIQLYVVALICSSVFGVEGYYAIAATSAVIALYLYFGGYASVVKTDALQFFMIMGLLFVPIFLPAQKADVLNFTTITSLGWQDSVGLFILGVFYIISGADTWQRMFSARSKRVVRWAFPLAGVFLLVMTLNLITIGYGLKLVLPEGTQADEALFALFTHADVVSPYILSFMGVTIMAISMSTLDTEAYVFTSSFVRNFLPTTYTQNRRKYIKASRVLILGVLLFTSFIAATISDVIQFLFDSVSLVYVVAPLLVFSIFGWVTGGKRQDVFLTSSITLAAAVYLGMFFAGGFVNILYNMIPLAVSVVLCALSLLVTRPKTKTSFAH